MLMQWSQLRMGQAVRIGVGLSLMGVLAWFLDLPTFFESFSTINGLMAVLLCVASCLDRILMAYKWNLLLAARGVTISTWHAIRLYVFGNLVGTVTPGGLGSDAYRVAALSSRHSTEVVLSSVFLERLLGLAVIGSIAAFFLPFSAAYFQADSTLVMAMVCGGALLTVLAIPISLNKNIVNNFLGRLSFLSGLKIANKLRHFHHVYAESRQHLGALATFTALTTVEVVFRIFLSFLAALSLNVPVDFWFMLCMMPMVFILGRLPISLQGIGVQEGLFAYVMVLGGFSAEQGVAIVLLLRAAGWVAMAIPAVVLMWFSPVPSPIAQRTGDAVSEVGHP